MAASLQGRAGLYCPLSLSEAQGTPAFDRAQHQFQRATTAAPAYIARPTRTASTPTGIQAALGSFATNRGVVTPGGVTMPQLLLSRPHVQGITTSELSRWAPQGTMPPPPASVAVVSGAVAPATTPKRQIPMWMYGRSEQSQPELTRASGGATTHHHATRTFIDRNPLQMTQTTPLDHDTLRTRSQPPPHRLTPVLNQNEKAWATTKQEWVKNGATQEQIDYYERLRSNARTVHADGSTRQGSELPETAARRANPPQHRAPTAQELQAIKDQAVMRQRQAIVLKHQDAQANEPIWSAQDVAASVGEESPKTRERRLRRARYQQQRALGKRRKPTPRKRRSLKTFDSGVSRTQQTASSEISVAVTSLQAEHTQDREEAVTGGMASVQIAAPSLPEVQPMVYEHR